MNHEFVMNLRARVAAIRRSGWVNTISAAMLLLTPMVFFHGETVRLLIFLGMNVGLLTPLQIPLLVYAFAYYRKLAREFRVTPEPSCHFLSFAGIYIDYLEGLALFNYMLALISLNVSILLGGGIVGGIGGVLIALAHMFGIGFPLARLRLHIETSLLNAEYAVLANAPETTQRSASWRPAVSRETQG